MNYFSKPLCSNPLVPSPSAHPRFHNIHSLGGVRLWLLVGLQLAIASFPLPPLPPPSPPNPGSLQRTTIHRRGNGHTALFVSRTLSSVRRPSIASLSPFRGSRICVRSRMRTERTIPPIAIYCTNAPTEEERELENQSQSGQKRAIWNSEWAPAWFSLQAAYIVFNDRTTMIDSWFTWEKNILDSVPMPYTFPLAPSCCPTIATASLTKWPVGTLLTTVLSEHTALPFWHDISLFLTDDRVRPNERFREKWRDSLLCPALTSPLYLHSSPPFPSYLMLHLFRPPSFSSQNAQPFSLSLSLLPTA